MVWWFQIATSLSLTAQHRSPSRNLFTGRQGWPLKWVYTKGARWSTVNSPGGIGETVLLLLSVCSARHSCTSQTHLNSRCQHSKQVALKQVASCLGSNPRRWKGCGSEALLYYSILCSCFPQIPGVMGCDCGEREE